MEKQPIIKESVPAPPPPQEGKEISRKIPESKSSSSSRHQWNNEKMPTLVNVVLPEEECPPPDEIIRCLICYNKCTEIDKNITSEEKPVITGKEMYKIFNLNYNNKNWNNDFNPPFCSSCMELVTSAQETLSKIDKLENSLKEVRQELKNILFHSFEKEEHDNDDAPSETLEEDEKMVENNDVLRLRQDVLLCIKRQLGIVKRPGRPKRKSSDQQMVISDDDEKSDTAADSENEPKKKLQKQSTLPDPYVLLQPLPIVKSESSTVTTTRRSKAGRVIKRPNRLMMISIMPTNKSNTSPDDDICEDEKTIKVTEQKDIKTEIDADDVVENTSLPDPEWLPIDKAENEEEEEEANSSSTTDDDEDDDEEEEEDEDYILPHRINKIKPKSKGNLGTKNANKSTLVKSNPTRKRKQIFPKISNIPKISIQVITPTGEKLDAYYIHEGIAANTAIEEGSIIPISNTVPGGVRILCTEGCPKTFRSLFKLQSHVRKVHKGVKSFDFESLRNFLTHSRKIPKAPRKLHFCNYEGCNPEQKYRSRNDLNIHIRSCHTLEKPFKCETCSESFVSGPKREVHIEHRHPEIPPHKCQHCPKAFFREHRLRDHIKSHTGEKSFLCEICSKSFSQQAYLNYHQTRHKELQRDPYKCNECDKTFATPINLKTHKRTQHENNFRYRCEICNHGADQLSHLKLHMITHSGERPHICESCGKTFSRASQLKIHQRNHTGERPYACETCKKAFTNSSKLRRHQMIHSDVKPFVCEFCDKGYTQLTNLNAHINSTHRKRDKSNKSISTPSKQQENEGILLMEVIEGDDENNAQPQINQQLQPTNAAEPIQFQVVRTAEEQQEGGGGDGTYAEFIIVNQTE